LKERRQDKLIYHRIDRLLCAHGEPAQLTQFFLSYEYLPLRFLIGGAIYKVIGARLESIVQFEYFGAQKILKILSPHRFYFRVNRVPFFLRPV
jgi:hypothetical protein